MLWYVLVPGLGSEIDRCYSRQLGTVNLSFANKNSSPYRHYLMVDKQTQPKPDAQHPF
jgi:hypothetical protein